MRKKRCRATQHKETLTMPEHIDPRGQDNPSNYFVEDRSSNPEMIRLMIQDRTITEGMGGPLSEQADPASLHRVLDIGCGPGSWLFEHAFRYPHFALMKDWPRILQEMLRVTRPGGTGHVTEGGNIQNSSPALTRLGQMMFLAGYKAGQSTRPEVWGITSILAQMLSESGCQSVHIKAYTLEYPAGTVAAQNFAQDSMYLFQTLLPFLRKWDCAPEDYDAIYEQT